MCTYVTVILFVQVPAVAAVHATGYHAMRSLDRSPGCTPIVGGTSGARVRMHSCPGHDNFAPLKSGTASPGGTPHARGQGRLPSVRVSPLAAAGHDQFNPLRSQIASPGWTPLRSEAGSVPGDALSSDAASAAGSGTILPYISPPDGPSEHEAAPVALSDDTANTGHMHVVVVSAPGHDEFNPVYCQSRSPGHTPRHSGDVHESGFPEVRIMAGPGHDAFAPMHAGDRSPGHTPGPASLAAARASSEALPAQNGSNPRLGSHGSPGLWTAPSVAQPQPIPDHVAFVSSPSHDYFHPLAATNASPGHTPRPSMEAAVASPMHVTFQSEPGHDHFKPIHDHNASPGHTPRHPGLGRATAPPLSTHHPLPGSSHINGKRVSIDAEVPYSHDCFQPMRMAEASPGHTPKGHVVKVWAS